MANVAQIVERALESSEAQGVELINTIVGLDPSNQALHELVGQQSSRIQVLEERNATLQQRLEGLGARISALEGGQASETVTSMESSSDLPVTWLLLGGGLGMAAVCLVLVQQRTVRGRR